MKYILMPLLLLSTLVSAQELTFTDPIFTGAKGTIAYGVKGSFSRTEDGVISIAVKVEDNRRIVIETWSMEENDCDKTIRPYAFMEWTKRKVIRDKAVAGTHTLDDRLTGFLCLLNKSRPGRTS